MRIISLKGKKKGSSLLISLPKEEGIHPLNFHWWGRFFVGGEIIMEGKRI